MKRYFNAAFIYLFLGLGLGVFYREFTKLNGFEGQTILRGVHTHTLVLGFIFLLVVLLLDKNFGFSKIKSSMAWFITYNVSLIYVITVMIIRGIGEVRGFEVAGLNHIAGLAHFLLGASLIWFMVLGNKMLKQNNQ